MKTPTAIILLLSAIVATNFFYRANNIHTIKVTANHCELQKISCTVRLTDQSQITFSINPKPIPLLKQLTLKAKLKGITADEVHVNIIGINMDMGILPYQLKNISNGEFTGNAALGVCSVRKMGWTANLHIKTGQENYLISFPFTTIKN